MPRISSYIFLDLETTGLPHQENYQTKVTELCMMAVHREHFLNSDGYPPRVLPKLVLCFKPNRTIHPKAFELSGLNNDLLSTSMPFSFTSVDLMINFIQSQEPPVCFVAHNGNRFDYPILKAEIANQLKSLPETLLCMDSIVMFRDILKADIEMPFVEPMRITSNGEHLIDDNCINDDDLDLISKVEREYLSEMASPLKNTEANQNTTIAKPKAKRKSYRLADIYYSLYDKCPQNLHTAEGDCLTLMMCCLARSVEFINWAENHNAMFSNIIKMEPRRNLL